MNEQKYKFIDLFAGCGGLEDGFLQSGKYEDIAAVEWLQPQVNTLRKRLETKWNISDASERVMCFDIRREQELFCGWDDDSELPQYEILPDGKKSRYKTGPYGKGKGLDYFVNQAGGIDIIIGGPPCQAYSIAGRVKDGNGMKNDYRNYLFEHYLSVVNRYKPKVFLFENVPGMLSATPDGMTITDLIRKGFEGIGYEIVDDLRNYAKIDACDYGVPQHRERIIILGIRKGTIKDPQTMLRDFYTTVLTHYKVEHKRTVEEAIGNLPAAYPIIDGQTPGKRITFTKPECNTTWHVARRHSLRDIEIFRMLAEDIETGRNKYTNSKALSDLYEERVGAKSQIHRYHVLRKDEPSTTIISHLDRDGNRFIHYDPKQSRSITPREAARIQSFDNDFDFLGNQTDTFIMIGNAVPPVLAKCIALAVADVLEKLK
jgi:DNA (cytosine-5)-methyltransferase 1